MTARTRCPVCGIVLRLPAGSVGKRVACGGCKRQFTCKADMLCFNGAAAVAAFSPGQGATAPSFPGAGIIHCPHCQNSLRPPPHFKGKKLRCPLCLQMFPANPAVPTPLEKLALPAARDHGRAADFVRAGCPGCRSPVKLKRYLAGRRVRCPWCGQLFRAPAVQAKDGALRSRLLAEVRQMRARDQGRELAPQASGYHVAAEEAQTRKAEPLPSPISKEAKQQLPEMVETWDPLPEELELAKNGPLRRRSTKPGRGDYPRVQTGITLNQVAASVLLGVFVIVLIAILFSSKTLYQATDPLNYPSPAPQPGLPIGTICLAILAIVSEGIHIVGLVYCLGAPRKDSAQNLAFLSLIASAAGLTFLCTAGALGLAGRSGAGIVILLVGGIVIMLAAKVLYLLFLRGLGLALEVVWLARQVFGTISLFVAAALFHLIVLAATGFRLTADIAGVVNGTGSGEGLQNFAPALFFWGGSLLILLYALIRNVITANDARNEVVYYLMRRK